MVSAPFHVIVDLISNDGERPTEVSPEELLKTYGAWAANLARNVPVVHAIFTAGAQRLLLANGVVTNDTFLAVLDLTDLATRLAMTARQDVARVIYGGRTWPVRYLPES